LPKTDDGPKTVIIKQIFHIYTFHSKYFLFEIVDKNISYDFVICTGGVCVCVSTLTHLHPQPVTLRPMAITRSQRTQMELPTRSCCEASGSLGRCVKYFGKVVTMKRFYTVQVLSFKVPLKNLLSRRRAWTTLHQFSEQFLPLNMNMNRL
jgi:hypothetical protein